MAGVVDKAITVALQAGNFIVAGFFFGIGWIDLMPLLEHLQLADNRQTVLDVHVENCSSDIALDSVARLYQLEAALQVAAEVGVGALGLVHAATPFTLKDAGTLGAIRSSGVYLSEAGVVGSLQQVDVIV